MVLGLQNVGQAVELEPVMDRGCELKMMVALPCLVVDSALLVMSCHLRTLMSLNLTTPPLEAVS